MQALIAFVLLVFFGTLVASDHSLRSRRWPILLCAAVLTFGYLSRRVIL